MKEVGSASMTDALQDSLTGAPDPKAVMQIAQTAFRMGGDRTLRNFGHEPKESTPERADLDFPILRLLAGASLTRATRGGIVLLAERAPIGLGG